MKRIICLTLLFIAFIAFNQTANAQEDSWLSSPKEFRTFYFKFKKAVESNDRAKVASMTVFPFEYGFDTGNEGKWTRRQFIKNFNEVFGKNPRKFFSGRKFEFTRGDGRDYFVSTDDAVHLMFFKKGNVFKFASYVVEP